MMTVGEAENGFTAQVELASGELVGEGYGPNAECAKFYAVYDALRSADQRHRTAGLGHRVFLSAADQELLTDEKVARLTVREAA